MAEVFKLGIAANNNQPIKEVNSIEVLANKGILGDRHFHDFNDPYNQLSLIESENIDEYNIKQIAEKYDYIVDGSDNFKTKFLINDFCIRQKKFLVSGAINKFDGHIFTFNFNKKDTPCLRCFFQEDEIPEDIFNCEYDGVLGTVANTVGSLQANEVLKQILKTGKNLNGYMLILDLLNLDFRKVKLNKRDKCLCELSLK